MARRFAKVSEEEIEEAFFYPSDLVNAKTTIPLRVGEERWIYTSTRLGIYPPLFTSPSGDSYIISIYIPLTVRLAWFVFILRSKLYLSFPYGQYCRKLVIKYRYAYSFFQNPITSERLSERLSFDKPCIRNAF